MRLVECGEAHLKVAASSVTRRGMAEGSDVSDTAQSGHSPRATDVGDGVLAPTAGAEKGWGCPQSQSQFWRGEGCCWGRVECGNASQGEPHPGHWLQHLPHMQNKELGGTSTPSQQ